MWSGNAGEIHSGEGLDVEGVGVVVHHGKVHGADPKVGGPKWHLCVHHGDFWNEKKNSYGVSSEEQSSKDRQKES